MFWRRKSSGPGKKGADAKGKDVIDALGGAEEVERLERELDDFRKKGVTVRMETGPDGKKILVPVEPTQGKGKK